MQSNNPFIYYRPVPPDRFVGRASEIDRILSALANPSRNSTAINGEPNIGKTSLLHYLCTPHVRERWGLSPNWCHFLYLDVHSTAPYSEATFWHHALRQLERHHLRNDEVFRGRLRWLLEQTNPDIFDLNSFFDEIAQAGHLVVLLLDEFELIIENLDQHSPDFLYHLRALLNRPERGLALIVATRKPLHQLCSKITFTGSPFENSFLNITLPPFSRAEVVELVNKYQVNFSPIERELLHQMAGTHPALLQIAGDFLLREHHPAPIADSTRQKMIGEFERLADSYFSDFWQALSTLEQTLLLLIILMHPSGQLSLQSDISLEDFRVLLLRYQREIMSLVRRGIIEELGGTYQVSSAVFALWIVRKIAAESEASLTDRYITTGEPLSRIWQILRRFAPEFTFDRFIISTDLRQFIENVADLTNLAATDNKLRYNQIIQQVYHQLCQKLQINQEDKDPKRYSGGKVTAYWLGITEFLKDLNLPKSVPFLFLGGAELAEEDIVKVRDILAQDLSTVSQTAILFIPASGSLLDRVYQNIDERLRHPYAYNIVVFGPEDLERIAISAESRYEFRRIFLSQVDLLTVSPFIINGPTSEQMFFGREQEQRTIAEQAKTSSHAVIGGRRMGKTSILTRLCRARLPAAGFRTLYHDCSSTSTYEFFLSAAIREWRPEPPSVAPITFYDLFQSPPIDKPLVIFLDEADKLVPHDQANGWRLFNALRALVNSGCAQIVFSGERILRSALRDPTSPLFNLANELLLGPLDYRAAEELITQPMKQLEIELVDESTIVHCIYDFTSGHPNVIQRLCRRLIEQLNEQGSRRILLDDVNLVIRDPKFQRDDFLSTYWEAATRLEKIISLLMANDKNIHTLHTVRQALRKHCDLNPKAREIDDALQRLVDLRSILKRTATGYEFAVKSFPRVVAGTITSNDMLEILIEEYQEEGG